MTGMPDVICLFGMPIDETPAPTPPSQLLVCGFMETPVVFEYKYTTTKDEANKLIDAIGKPSKATSKQLNIIIVSTIFPIIAKRIMIDKKNIYLLVDSITDSRCWVYTPKV